MYDDLNPKDENATFLPVVFVHDSQEADYYQSLLEDHGITVHINEDYDDHPDDTDDGHSAGGIAIMVDPDQFADAAGVIKARKEDEDNESDDEDHYYNDHDHDDMDDLQEFDPDEENH